MLVIIGTTVWKIVSGAYNKIRVESATNDEGGLNNPT